ncbi:hypothetical protein GO290_02784 [Ralstonia solanacearum]|nr:hypothetical protein [Ralstonia solanacearum]
MKKISLCLSLCAALATGVAHAQAPLGVDMTATQAAQAQADTLKRPETATQSAQVGAMNTQLLAQIQNTQRQMQNTQLQMQNTQLETLETLKAIEAKLK